MSRMLWGFAYFIAKYTPAILLVVGAVYPGAWLWFRDDHLVASGPRSAQEMLAVFIVCVEVMAAMIAFLGLLFTTDMWYPKLLRYLDKKANP